jgi:hypothetical protein
MNTYIIEELTALTKTNKTASIVLGALMGIVLRQNNPYGALIIKNSDLMDLTGYKSTRSIVSAIKALKEYGFIGVGKMGRVNVYIINPDVLNTKSGERKTNTNLDYVHVYVNSNEGNYLKQRIKALQRKSSAIRNAAQLNSRTINCNNTESRKQKNNNNKVHTDDSGNQYMITKTGERINLSDFV